jgi:Cd(II)/Pb(II)-responsive transcriptional regulator
MKIGELAVQGGCDVQTVRYYEREGLLPAARRADNNYRHYTTEHADHLSFIRHCRSLDMPLDDIRSLLRFRDAPPDDCAAVNALLDTHIEQVARRIHDLRALERGLRELRAHCLSRHSIDEWGILKELDSDATVGHRGASARRAARPAVPHRSADRLRESR